ncbi:MAG: hypothetical protein Q9227_003461 [Pyrenula ochraceoflavens]
MASVLAALESLTEIPTATETENHHHHHHDSTAGFLTNAIAATTEQSSLQSIPTLTGIVIATDSTQSSSTQRPTRSSRTSQLLSSSTTVSSSSITKSSSSTSSRTSASSNLHTSTTSTGVANPLQAHPSRPASSKQNDGNSVSTAGIVVGVFLSLVVLGAIFCFIYFQRQRIAQYLKRHRGQDLHEGSTPDEEVAGLKGGASTSQTEIIAGHTQRDGDWDDWSVRQPPPVQHGVPVAASLDRPFSDPNVPESINHSSEISPVTSPTYPNRNSSYRLSTISQSQYKPLPKPFTYSPYTYNHSPARRPVGAGPRAHMGTPGRVLPAYARAQSKDGVWEVESPSSPLLNKDLPHPPS